MFLSSSIVENLKGIWHYFLFLEYFDYYLSQKVTVKEKKIFIYQQALQHSEKHVSYT